MKIVKHLSILPFLLLVGIMLPFGSAFSAEAKSNGEWVEVPPALGPEAVTTVVSKLDFVHRAVTAGADDPTGGGRVSSV